MIEPIKLDFGREAEERFKKFLRTRILQTKAGLQDLHENRLPAMRRVYKAIPLEKVREFPFHNASNIVIPVVAIYADTLLSRIMAAIFKTMPIWVLKSYGSHTAAEAAERDLQRKALEDALQYYGIEPSELDLYRVYNEWLGCTIRYGTDIVKVPWETQVESFKTPAGDGNGKYEDVDEVIYDGPRPERIQLDDFFVSPNISSLATCDFKAHRRRMEKWELEEKRFRQIYDASKVDLIIKSPSRQSPTSSEQEQQTDSGAMTAQGYGYAEWDIWECWCRYRIGTRLYRVVASYHLETDTLVRAFYTYYPEDIFVAARLFFEDGMFFGMGFCEALGQFQEEITTIHNQRRDAITVANCNLMRVSPDSKLNAGYRIFPGATIPAEKDEIEPLKFGEPSQMTIEEERMSFDLAERRAGVSQPLQGMGSGSFNKKGNYSAMGTLSVMQEGNNRTDLNITDMRYAHARLGRIVARQMAEFKNTPDAYGMFGIKAERIVAALKALRSGTLALPIQASNASINREVEKQNDLMLSNVASRHYGMITQMLQASAQQMIPPEVKTYLKDAIKAANQLMTDVFQHFNYDEPERLVPEPHSDEPGQQQQVPSLQGAQPNPQAPQQPGGDNVLSMAERTPIALPSGASGMQQP